MPRSLLPILLLALLGALAPGAAAGDERPAYPATPAGDVVDRMHGVDVPDPFRWLEDDAAPAVVAWDEAQGALLRARLDAAPRRAELRARLEAEFGLGDMPSVPRFRGGFRWTTLRSADADHAVVRRAGPRTSGVAQVVLDPNTWSADGTSSLKAWEPSPDGRYVAYRRDVNGSEETTLYVRDVETGRDLPERITRTKFSDITWSQDGRGFFYQRMPDPESVPEGEAQYHTRIHYHRLGTLVLDDPVVYGRGRPMLEDAWIQASADRRHLFLGRGLPYQSVDTFECELVGDELRLEPRVVGGGDRTWVDRSGDVYVLDSDRFTGLREVFLADRTPEGGMGPWRRVEFPRGPRDVVEGTAIAGGTQLLIHVRSDVVSRLFVRALAGGPVREIALPGPGTVEAVSARPEDATVWFRFESYAVPPTNYRCDLSQGTPGLQAEEVLPTSVAVAHLVSTQATYPSKDGTPIPIFLLRRDDVPCDGRAPAILYGYGGFRVGMKPHFSRTWALWAETGGVLAVACLRGGDEFGEDWHRAGCLGAKQNVFDDFIAGADWLVATGKASRARLAVQGGSNGGLLVAACVDQRPDLCRAAICAVPLTDMLRYHRFQYARSWTKEYGDPDDAEAFAWLRAYSPYHNVKPGTPYPAVLLTAGLHDGRVNAFHARKMAAQWQRATTSSRPILLRVDRKGGHGAAGLSRRLQEKLDEWCFLLEELGG